MFWPGGLVVFYPYPEICPYGRSRSRPLCWPASAPWPCAASVPIPILRSDGCGISDTLIPVIGLVQVGAQARADRYTYIPLVGLLDHTWLGARQRWPCAGRTDQTCNRRVSGSKLRVLCGAYVRSDPILAKQRIALPSTPSKSSGGNYVAEHNLGTALMEQPGRLARGYPASRNRGEHQARFRPRAQ